jgi:HEAT repeat protein
MKRIEFLMAAVFLCVLPLAGGQDKNEDKAKIKGIRQYAKEGSSAIPKIAPYLDDQSQEVRYEAAKSISELGSQDSVTPLVKATSDGVPEIQMMAVAGLVNFYYPGYIESGLNKLTTGFKGKFTDTNTQTIPAYINVRPDVIAAIANVLRSSPSPEARATAARAEGVLRGSAAVPDLTAALRSKDDSIMYESFVALQKIGDKSAGPAVAVYVRDLDVKVKIAAIETVGLLKYKEGVPDLERVYNDASNDKVRRAALTSLAMLAEPQSRQIFLSALNDKDDGVRAAAAEGIGRLGNPQDVATLEKLFADERKMNPRLAEAFALVLLGKTEVSEFSPLQYLVNTLNSTAYRGVAEAYLTELARKPEIRESLYTALDKGTKDEKKGIARVLSVSGDKRSLEKLQPLTRDTDLDVAQESIRAVKALQAKTL